MKVKALVIIASILTIISLITFVIKSGTNYHKVMSGVVLDKYHFYDQSRNYTSDDLVMVVKYPDLITKHRVDANTWYSLKIGDNVSFDEDLGSNNYSLAALIIACFIFVFVFIFSIEYEDKPIKPNFKEA